MKKFIALLIGCSLALTVSVQAKEQNDQTDQANAKKQSQKPKNVQKQQFTPKQQQLKTQNTQVRNMRTERVNKPVVTTTHQPVVKKQEFRKVTPVQTHTQTNVQSKKFEKNKQQLQTTNQQQLQTSNQQVQKNKLNQQQIQQIRTQHRNFKAQRNNSITSVQFNQNYQITNAQNWSGSNYQVFRSYRPQWHDHNYWRSHYSRLSLIAGGWYFWNAGYWYPAWGYDDAYSYYPYDGPIYSGPSARPFDQVVADVQAVLQEQGFYRGEVDGLLGPLTRQALAEYQSSHGLYATETIDQPTLSSLGLAG
jgi:hypothetical protein